MLQFTNQTKSAIDLKSTFVDLKVSFVNSQKYSRQIFGLHWIEFHSPRLP